MKREILTDILKDKDTRININPTINIKGTEY